MSIPWLEQQEDQESGAQQFGCLNKQHCNVHGTAGLNEITVEPDDDGRVFFGPLRGCSGKATSVAGDRLEESLRRDAQGKGNSTRATEGEADLRRIGARDQIADCLTKHASRNSEEVLQEVINCCAPRQKKRCWRHDGKRERPLKFRQEARKRRSTRKQLFWKTANTEVRTMSHGPSA